MGNMNEVAPLSVTMTMTPEIAAQLQQENGALTVAEAYVIDSADIAQLANDELRSVKARIAKVKELKQGFVAPAKQIIANAEALFDPALEALGNAETLLKDRLLAWTRAESERVAEERRKTQEAERLARQRAEQEAAAARAKAEQVAAEERRKAEESERARKEAEAAGNAAEARRAAEAAAKAQERATAAIENGEAKAQSAVLTTAAAPAPTVSAPAKLAGFGTRENWIAELKENVTEQDALRLIVAEAATRPEMFGYLKLDISAINRSAKALKSNASIPGFVVKDEPIASSRKA